MILHNNADVPFTREELSRRESVSAEMENVWLSAMFETDGFAVTPTLGLEAGNVTLTRGVAVGSVNGSRRLIIIPPQRLPYPAVQGNYTLYVKPEAWVDLHPSLGVSGGAIYLDSASYAYASGQLAADTGLIQMIGVVITVPEAAADNWLPLAAVTVPADPTQTVVSDIAVQARLRGATNVTQTTGGDFYKNGSVPMSGDFDAGNHNLKNVGSINAGALTNVNASKVGGYTAAQLMGGAAPATTSATEVYRVGYVANLDINQQIPKLLSATLPDTPDGLEAAVTFTGEGTLVSVSGTHAQFMPALRVRGSRNVQWPNFGVDTLLGQTVGIAGMNPSYYTSVSYNLPAQDSAPAQHVRQLLRTTVGGIVTVFDQEVTPNADNSATLPPYPIGLANGPMTWGGRAQGVTLTLNGNPNDQSVSTPSAYVGGTRLGSLDLTGLTLEDLSVALNGVINMFFDSHIATIQVGA